MSAASFLGVLHSLYFLFKVVDGFGGDCLLR